MYIKPLVYLIIRQGIPQVGEYTPMDIYHCTILDYS